MTLPADPFASFTTGLSDPATNGFAVTPDDDNDLPVIARYLHINAAGGGHVAVLLKDQAPDDTPIVFTVVDAQVLPYRVRRVMDTDTDATDIIALY